MIMTLPLNPSLDRAIELDELEPRSWSWSASAKRQTWRSAPKS